MGHTLRVPGRRIPTLFPFRTWTPLYLPYRAHRHFQLPALRFRTCHCRARDSRCPPFLRCYTTRASVKFLRQLLPPLLPSVLGFTTLRGTPGAPRTHYLPRRSHHPTLFPCRPHLAAIFSSCRALPACQPFGWDLDTLLRKRHGMACHILQVLALPSFLGTYKQPWAVHLWVRG